MTSAIREQKRGRTLLRLTDSPVVETDSLSVSIGEPFRIFQSSPTAVTLLRETVNELCLKIERNNLIEERARLIDSIFYQWDKRKRARVRQIDLELEEIDDVLDFDWNQQRKQFLRDIIASSARSDDLLRRAERILQSDDGET
ncbi:MAG TPA: hypothetical protein PLC15_11130 [Candidatus Obscuribacter sp.]|nr:hypothetical protein [Candidatus Obscuribacter sp.]HNH73805.1 hypothetical protein [Candidatus Obscuribacter sp.]